MPKCGNDFIITIITYRTCQSLESGFRTCCLILNNFFIFVVGCNLFRVGVPADRTRICAFTLFCTCCRFCYFRFITMTQGRNCLCILPSADRTSICSYSRFRTGRLFGYFAGIIMFFHTHDFATFFADMPVIR